MAPNGNAYDIVKINTSSGSAINDTTRTIWFDDDDTDNTLLQMSDIICFAAMIIVLCRIVVDDDASATTAAADVAAATITSSSLVDADMKPKLPELRHMTPSHILIMIKYTCQTNEMWHAEERLQAYGLK